MKVYFLLPVILVIFAQSSSCQILEATQVAAKLPYAMLYHASLYDGNDTIFILGGFKDTGLNSKVYRYSIADDTVEEVAAFPRYVYDGFGIFDEQGDILFMGAANVVGNQDGNIYKLKRSNWDLQIVETNRTFGRRCRGIKAIDGSNTLLIPADTNELGFMFCLNLTTFASCESSFGFPLLTEYTKVRPFVYEDHAYLTGTFPSGFIEKVNLKTLESELIDANLPYLSEHDVIFDGTYAYFIGLTDDEFPMNGIIRFNPQNMEHQLFPVENFPVNHTDPGSHWSDGSAVYVEKLNRIYFSGGHTYPGSGASVTRDEIWYIDLAPLSSRN